MTALILDPNAIRDIRPLVMTAGGKIQVVPAQVYRDTTIQERALLGAREALYCLPTHELVQWLSGAIGGRRAIEIGAGNGVLSAALGITATDNKLQSRADIIAHYKALGQATITYG